MQNGRLLQMSLELLIATVACLAASILLPLSFWQSLGHSGSSLLILAAGTLVTASIVVRNRPVATELAIPTAVEPAA